MSGRLRGQHGFTLIELLVAMSLMLVVLSATLSTFNRFYNNTRKSERFNDQLQQVRQSTDRIVKQLRSLANPTGGTGTIAVADPFMLIFQTTDPSRQWVAYCLDYGQSGGSGTRDNEIIWYQTSSASGSPPGTSGCPVSGVGWATRPLTRNVTNERNSSDDQPATARPLFSYFSGSDRVGLSGSAFVTLNNTNSSPLSSVVTRVVADLFIADNPTNRRAPNETELQTGAYMRNQNQLPVARMSAFGTGTPKTFSLDAGDSTDPEGRTLLYDWYAVQGSDPSGSTDFPPSASALPSCVLASGQTVLPTYRATPPTSLVWQCLGQGVILTHDFTPEGASPQFVFVRVTDPGGLQDLVDEPSSGGCVVYTDTSRPATQCTKITY